MQIQYEEKVAELKQKNSAINHKEEDVCEISSQLHEKGNLLEDKEKELQLRMEALVYKDELIQNKDDEVSSMEKQICQLEVGKQTSCIPFVCY